jgi:hypothetical protein
MHFNNAFHAVCLLRKGMGAKAAKEKTINIYT